MTGTPKTLGDLAIDIVSGDLKAVSTRVMIRDYLAQQFGAAMLDAPTPEEEIRLKNLFERIVGESRTFIVDEETGR